MQSTLWGCTEDALSAKLDNWTPLRTPWLIQRTGFFQALQGKQSNSVGPQEGSTTWTYSSLLSLQLSSVGLMSMPCGSTTFLTWELLHYDPADSWQCQNNIDVMIQICMDFTFAVNPKITAPSPSQLLGHRHWFHQPIGMHQPRTPPGHHHWVWGPNPLWNRPSCPS